MLSALNRIRLDGPPPLPNETFASAIVVVIESGAVDCRYASAGHHIGLVAQGTAHRHLMPTGPVLGIIDDATFSDVSEPFSDRDLLLLATDGFTECRSASQPWHQFGTAGIARAIAGTTPHQWATAARLVAANADAFTGGHYRDDATLAVLARATPPGFA
jgi:serine phosphatase RsbU (regulator of sigma subunit)